MPAHNVVELQCCCADTHVLLLLLGEPTAARYLVHGAIFYAFSQVSHIQQECFDPQPHRSATLKCGQSIATSGGNPVQNADSAFHENRDQQIDARLRCGTKALGSDVVNHDWAISQVAHTADYSCSSDLWLWLSNGLNHQTAHHLFPGVDWCHHKVCLFVTALMLSSFPAWRSFLCCFIYR